MRPVADANHVIVQFTKQQIEELRAADRMHRDMAAFDRPILRRFAIPAARDVNANDAAAKPLKQDLGVGRVIAQIGNDERLAVVQAINRCQCFRARAGVELLRQFVEVPEIDELRRKRAASADNRRRAVFCAADIVRDDERPAELPGVGMYGRFRCALIELPFKRTNMASCRNAEEFTFVGRFTERASFLLKIGRVVQSRRRGRR